LHVHAGVGHAAECAGTDRATRTDTGVIARERHLALALGGEAALGGDMRTDVGGERGRASGRTLSPGHSGRACHPGNPEVLSNPKSSHVDQVGGEAHGGGPVQIHPPPRVELRLGVPAMGAYADAGDGADGAADERVRRCCGVPPASVRAPVAAFRLTWASRVAVADPPWLAVTCIPWPIRRARLEKEPPEDAPICSQDPRWTSPRSR